MASFFYNLGPDFGLCICAKSWLSCIILFADLLDNLLRKLDM